MHGTHGPLKELDPKELAVLLRHMLEHNKSHAEELHHIAHGLEKEKEELLHKVVLLYEEADRQFEEALAKLGF